MVAFLLGGLDRRLPVVTKQTRSAGSRRLLDS
jgi:hypothetical protein